MAAPRGVPGAHVIIRGAGKAPDEATVRAAAQLAAYHSGARGDAAVAVIVTRKRWVQRAPGGKVGQVLVKQEERVVTVPGELPESAGRSAGWGGRLGYCPLTGRRRVCSSLRISNSRAAAARLPSSRA